MMNMLLALAQKFKYTLNLCIFKFRSQNDRVVPLRDYTNRTFAALSALTEHLRLPDLPVSLNC